MLLMFMYVHSTCVGGGERRRAKGVNRGHRSRGKEGWREGRSWERCDGILGDKGNREGGTV